MVQPASPAFTITYNKFGKILEFPPIGEGGVLSPETTKIMGALAALVMTNKPVKRNDTWQPDVVNPVVKGEKIPIKDTYLGSEKIEGKDYWKIKQTSEAVAETDGNKIS